MRRAPNPRNPSRDSEPRINDRIRARRVLVIDETGKKLGEFMPADAVQLAQERGLDLVEVSPNVTPPVCKVMDYGQYKYEKKKRDREAKKKQATVSVKEIRLRPKTDDHDIDFKVKNARKFLEQGHKVKVTIRFRGREHAHHDIGAEQCRAVAELLEDVGTVELMPRMEGRQMFMLLAPK